MTPTCASCHTTPRYKCPRCAAPSCSLGCARKHKQDTKCTGERDKAEYVPMNAYGWGTMMRDYCYLEDVGRKVGDWGDAIVRGGYATTTKSNGRKSKRDVLAAHLDALDIAVEFLPAGMDRRNANQSRFDHRSKCALLTVEFVFHPPTTLDASAPYKTLSHRNVLSASLLSLLQRHVSSQKHAPDWLQRIVAPCPEAPDRFVPPLCYVRANTDFPHPTHHYKLDPTVCLGELLRSTSFVEFPTVHVFDPGASSFRGTIVDKTGSIVRASQEDQPDVAREAKRRKLDGTAGTNAVLGMIGEYGSDAEESTTKRSNGLTTLDAYSGSDDQESLTDAKSISEDAMSPELDRPDPAKLLQLVEQARRAADQDTLDWGDEWDTSAEE